MAQKGRKEGRAPRKDLKKFIPRRLRGELEKQGKGTP